jgi:hypothetical protein
MKKKRFIIIGSVVIVLTILVGVLFFSGGKATGQVSGEPGRYIPLTADQAQKASATIVNSEFIDDVPNKNPVALVFYDFDEQGRYWQDGFLIGKGQLLTEGEPAAYIMLHSKYISELDGNNICDVVTRANKKGDLAFQSDYGNAKLLIKYAGMLKHRECFGF